MPISNLGNGLRTGVCTSTNRPTTPYEGQHIYETDTDIEYVWSGTAWVVNYVSAASPTFTGTPLAPTATTGTNTTQLATTAFANAAGGLVYVTSATIGTTVSSVTISNCFSTTYDNYMVLISGMACSNSGEYIAIRPLVSVGNYRFGGNYVAFATGTVVGTASLTSDYMPIGFSSSSSSYLNDVSVEVYAPFLSRTTKFNSNNSTQNYSTTFNGLVADTTSVTALTIIMGVGTMTGGTITVYGYRKA